jgi:hypothetical protein
LSCKKTIYFYLFIFKKYTFIFFKNMSSIRLKPTTSADNSSDFQSANEDDLDSSIADNSDTSKDTQSDTSVSNSAPATTVNSSVEQELRDQIAELQAQLARLQQQVTEDSHGYWQRSTLRERTMVWTKTFTGHGLPQLVPNPQPWYRRVVWCLLFVLSFVGLIAQITPIVQSHLANSVGSLVSRTFAPGLRFPAVTVCPKNALKCTCDAWEANPIFEGLLCGGDPSYNITAPGIAALVSAGWEPDKFFAARDAMRACGENTIAGRTVSTAAIVAAAASNKLDGEELLIYGGYALDEIVEACQLADGTDCLDERLWAPLFHEERLCWTLNGPSYVPGSYPELPDFVVLRAGEQGALSLTIKHNLASYSVYQETFGASILLHDQNVSALYNPGVAEISPQMAVRVSFVREEFTLLGAPFLPHCAQSPPLPYSTSACLETCWAQIVVEECGCQIPGLATNSSKSLRWCSFLDNYWCDDLPEYCYGIENEDGDALLAQPFCAAPANSSLMPCCGFRVQNRFNQMSSTTNGGTVLDEYASKCNNEASAACLAPCRSVSYALRQSFAAIPNPGTVLDYEEYGDELPVYADQTQLTIFPENLNVFRIEQFESTTLVTMLAFVGGSMGMWNGLSFISIIEVAEGLVLIVAVTWCCGRRERKHQPKQP